MSVIQGVPEPFLESISWQKPGVVRVEVSQYMLSRDYPKKNPAVPKVSDFIDLDKLVLRFVASSVRRDGISMKWTWAWVGGWTNLYSPTDRQPEDQRQEVWSMNVSMMQIPISQHPNIMNIKEIYGGVIKDGSIEFPRYLNSGQENPYYGITSFYCPGIELSVEAVRPGFGAEGLSFPQIDSVGVSEWIPAAPSGVASGFAFVAPKAASNRKPWLLVEHSVRRTGAQHVESKTWRYGGVLGWLDQLYDLDWSYSKKSSGSSGGALSVSGMGAR